eukprot:4491687-Amphidinium_carterae.1
MVVGSVFSAELPEQQQENARRSCCGEYASSSRDPETVSNTSCRNTSAGLGPTRLLLSGWY